ncbi:unnamed protein product [Paramecium primaurelia]|uniref:Enoyl reductase (ER) domain-containing protein n=1 Tax=Paramecium primaurelia TaxID=5886 RepID=A0A8S1MIU3_PARPR|nr:unnamed protein product [Paramecium primaurelia]
MSNLQVQLIKKPDAKYPRVNDVFQVKTASTPTVNQLKDGEVLLENLYFSIDATMRVWISGAKTYVDPVLPGNTMFGQAVSRVLASKSEKFQKGDYVIGLVNWTLYQIISDAKLHLIKRGGDIDDLTGYSFLGPLGISGLTAYIGFEAIGKPKEGETVVISAAAGAVGEIAVQLAKTYYKCKVIGIAGGPEKCDYVKKQLGAHDCIDYKNENLSKRLRELTPNGIHVYFDNVGGEMLDEILMHITDHTRIILCGAIATYNQTGEPYKVKNYPRLIIKRAVMQGFLYFDHPELFKPGQATITQMIKQGQLKIRYDVQNGLEQAPNGLAKLLLGQNNGKVVVKAKSDQPKL